MKKMANKEYENNQAHTSKKHSNEQKQIKML